MDQLGYATFCETFFQCCIKYLRMDNEIMKHRSLPSYEVKGRLLIEFINKIMIPFDVEKEIKM